MAGEFDSPETIGMTAQVAVAQSRAIAETQAAMTIAKKFPRDEERAIDRIRRSCQRRTLAECAQYVYSRGGTQITGPSIRLAECISQNWGNLESGVIELERNNGKSVAMAYAWDLETNARDVKVFEVAHVRETKNGNYPLKGDRDIYELVANMGARRKRACILAVIPGDVVDIAVEQCEATLKTNKEPLIDRARKMVAAFAELGVTLEMIESKIKHKLDAIIEQELVNLRKTYTSIRDGFGKREDYFDTGSVLVTNDPVHKPTATVEKEKAAESQVAKAAPMDELADFVISSGYTFSDFQKWCVESGNDKSADSKASFDEVSMELCRRLLRSDKTKDALKDRLKRIKEVLI